ncbi:MAG: DNA-directed RNA polymerase subunit N [Thermoprotei archaeon]
MLFPVRCFTCGKVIGNKWEEYKKRVGSGESPSSVLDSMGIVRYCCRRMFISHVEVVDDVMQFSVVKSSGTQGEGVE